MSKTSPRANDNPGWIMIIIDNPPTSNKTISERLHLPTVIARWGCCNQVATLLQSTNHKRKTNLMYYVQVNPEGSTVLCSWCQEYERSMQSKNTGHQTHCFSLTCLHMPSLSMYQSVSTYCCLVFEPCRAMHLRNMRGVHIIQTLWSIIWPENQPPVCPWYFLVGSTLW